MKRHSLFESWLNFLHSETHLKMPFYNFSSRCVHFCPQTFKAPISSMATACALSRNLLIFSILYWCVYALLFLKVMVISQSQYNKHLEQVHRLEKITGLPHRCFQDPIKLHRVDNKTTNQASWSCCSQSENGKSAIQLTTMLGLRMSVGDTLLFSWRAYQINELVLRRKPFHSRCIHGTSGPTPGKSLSCVEGA